MPIEELEPDSRIRWDDDTDLVEEMRVMWENLRATTEGRDAARRLDHHNTRYRLGQAARAVLNERST